MNRTRTCALRATCIAAAGLFVATGGAFGQAGNSSDAPSSKGAMSHMKTADSKFAMEAAMGGMEEVELGRLAAQKGQSDKVKQFGQRMADDHSKANDELKSIASKDGITLPTELDAKHKAMVDKMSAMSGDAFDRAYVANMVKDHQKDVADFQKESSGGSNDDIKSFATRTLPTLQDHLRSIQEIHSSMGDKMNGKMSSK